MRLPESSILYVASQLCALLSSVRCADETDAFDDDTSTHMLKNIHSFFYMSTNEKLDSLGIQDSRKNELPVAVATQPSSCRELEEQNTQEAIFYKRLIAVLLSNLAMQKTDDKLIGTLHIEASSSQLEYLQNFVNGQGSMREVDKILESVIKQSGYSMCHYMTELSRYFDLLMEFLKHYLSIMKEHWDITIISFTVIVSFMFLRRQRLSRGLIIFLMFDVIFVISFFITWWRLIQEAEIKLMAAQAQFAEMPITCQPHKMGMWDKMVASFWHTNDCEKYYETLMTNPRLQVTPALALTHFLSTAIFQPLSYFGLVISEFIDNATSKLNFFYKLPITLALFISFCICLVLLPFFLFGGSINLGIGPFFRFGIRGRERPIERRERIDRIHEDTLSEKKLKDSKEIKQIMLEQDPAGGDAAMNAPHLNEKCEECSEKHSEKEGDGDGC